MIESSGPLNWAVTPSAREARMAPVGALLNSSLGVASAASCSCASMVLGKLLAAADCLTCCSGAVSQAASLAASSLCSEVSGTERNAPPQLEAPPGKTSAKSQPASAPAPADSSWPLMVPSIQPGQTNVAKDPSVNALPLAQSHFFSLADRPASVLAASCRNCSFMAALSSMFSSPSAV